jgi:hypothetical protein
MPHNDLSSQRWRVGLMAEFGLRALLAIGAAYLLLGPAMTAALTLLNDCMSSRA